MIMLSFDILQIMKQWYSFYSANSDTRVLISNLEGQINTYGSKLNQLGSEICEKKLNQPDSEMIFPSLFAFVPWKHHVMIAFGLIYTIHRERRLPILQKNFLLFRVR